MSGCAVRSFADTVPIALGLRVGIVGSEPFTSRVRCVVQKDADVASVVTSITLQSCQSDRPLNLLIVEAASVGWAVSVEVDEILNDVSLIGLAGPAAENLPALANITTVDFTISDWWSRLKKQTVQRRFQELHALMNALAGDLMDLVDAEKNLTIDNGGQSSTVPISSVDWIRAAGRYVEVRVNGHSYLLRSEMHNVQSRLNDSFLRIHRRVIINTRRLIHLEHGERARLFAILDTGDRFPISRTCRRAAQSHWEERRGK